MLSAAQPLVLVLILSRRPSYGIASGTLIGCVGALLRKVANLFRGFELSSWWLLLGDHRQHNPKSMDRLKLILHFTPP